MSESMDPVEHIGAMLGIVVIGMMLMFIALIFLPITLAVIGIRHSVVGMRLVWEYLQRVRLEILGSHVQEDNH